MGYMNDSEYQELIEEAARRPLRAEEDGQLQAYLAEHPDKQPDWEAEAVLNRLLRHLPPAPVSSNFTAQVLSAAMRTKPHRRHHHHHRFRLISLRWLWSFARAWQGGVAVLVVGLALLAYSQHRVQSRAQLARSVATISALTPLPALEVLQEFDSIQSLPATRLADPDGLLAALK